MNNEPREKLRELIVEYGRSLCDDPRRCEALLKDYCGQYKREIFVLITAQKNRVADDLIKALTGVPQVMILARLVKRLEDAGGLAVDAVLSRLSIMPPKRPAYCVQPCRDFIQLGFNRPGNIGIVGFKRRPAIIGSIFLLSHR